MKQSIIILLTLIAFSACEIDKKKYDYIPEDKKPDLQNGDTVYFVNHQDNSLVDTFVISRYEGYRDYDKTRYVEYIDLNYKRINKSLPLFLYATYGLNGAIIDASTKENWTTYVANKPYTTELDINGMKYSVFIGVSKYPSPDLPDTLYFLDKEGLLKYKYSDTHYYEIKL